MRRGGGDVSETYEAGEVCGTGRRHGRPSGRGGTPGGGGAICSAGNAEEGAGVGEREIILIIAGKIHIPVTTSQDCTISSFTDVNS